MEEQLTEEQCKEIALTAAKEQFVYILLPMFERAWKENITEFRLVLRGNNDGPRDFYIHPLAKDGETITIDWAPISPIVTPIDEPENQ